MDAHSLTQHYYKTNTTSLSPSVLEWMDNPQLKSLQSFAKLDDGTIYLVGSYQGSDEMLYAVMTGQTLSKDPIALGYTNVFDLTRISPTTICFVQVQSSMDHMGLTGLINQYPIGGESSVAINIGCGNAANGFQTVKVNQERHNAAVFSLHGMENLLWFRLVTEEYLVRDGATGGFCNFYDILEYGQEFGGNAACKPDTFAVYSMNVTTMQVTSYSVEYEKQLRGPGRSQEHEEIANDDNTMDDIFINTNDDELSQIASNISTVVIETETSVFCQAGTWSRTRATGAFFLSAVPAVVGSARAWIKSAIPSASISLFFSIGYIIMCIQAFIEP